MVKNINSDQEDLNGDKRSLSVGDWIDLNYLTLSRLNYTVLFIAGIVSIYKYTPFLKTFKNVNSIPIKHFKKQKKLRCLLVEPTNTSNNKLELIHLPLISYILPIFFNRLFFKRSRLTARPFGVFCENLRSVNEVVDKEAYVTLKLLYKEDSCIIGQVKCVIRDKMLKKDLSTEILRRGLGKFKEDERPSDTFSEEIKDLRRLNKILDSLERLEKS